MPLVNNHIQSFFIFLAILSQPVRPTAAGLEPLTLG